MENQEEESKAEESEKEKKEEAEVTLPSTSDIKETPIRSSQVTEELLGKMVDLCEKQSETITKLSDRLNQLEEKHNTLSEDYQSTRPIEIRAEVMGQYDFSKNKEIMYKQSYNDEKQRARDIMNHLYNKYPRI